MNFSIAVYDEKHHLLRLTLSKDEKYRLFTPLSQIDHKVIAATLLQEDQYFRWHYGINPLAMLKAVLHTYIWQSRRIGASTITMQLARMRFGIYSKTLAGKVWQMLRAIQLERHYSKDQLLEAYLNLAPYGGNIEGVGAASLIYFNKPVKTATLSEALTLSVIPQNPTHRAIGNKHLKEIRDKLFLRWLKDYPSDRNKRLELNLPIVMQSVHSLPFIAPHFVNSVLKQYSYEMVANKNAFAPQVINTTLDVRLQSILERITKHYIKRNHHLGVYNAAVLLVDARNMGIKGLVGSANFFDHTISGQIDGSDIKRSPGSTLKPFIYGLALDQGLIHPNTVLKDVPSSFGNYNPDNFDYDFMGPIKAKDALILSRNIPAIYLANQLASPNLYQLLNAAHISHLKSESFYGLALTLGGVELTMKELASLYAMLLNDGVFRPLQYLQENEMIRSGAHLLSPEASFLVLDMLKDTLQLNEIRATAGFSANAGISWKTGTSSGFRDAWSVGALDPYVLVVWVGNFDNKANPAFVGKTIAAPLLFELLAAIKQEYHSISSVAKDLNYMNLRRIKVCKASGMLPTRYCQHTEMTWFIPGKSPIQSDTIHREVAINKTTGLRTCHFDCNTRFKIYEFWPSDILKIFKQAGIWPNTPPDYEPGCKLTETSVTGNLGLKPQITSPQTQVSYIIRHGENLKTSTNLPISVLLTNQIPLTAVTDADVKQLYWFINETFLTKTRPGEPCFWNAKPGKFVIRVVDDHGLSDARDITVQLDSLIP